MTKAIALVGALVDVRNYAQSKSVRLVVEVPAEQAGEVIREFGWPTPVSPVSVAVARLDMAVAQRETPKDTDKPKRAWGDLLPAQQAGIRCNEAPFRTFLAERHKVDGVASLDLDMAADAVRAECHIRSRKELVPGSEPAAAWHRLDADYEAWLRYGTAA